jgi:hypothetical protein
MHLAPLRPLVIAFALAGTFAAPPASADAGHDHGEARAATAAPGLPLFAAVSDLFELVGVVDGRRLTLYLDRAADNSPVPGAKLELELGGAKIDVKATGDGVFEAQLAQTLDPGVFPVTATVAAADETDLLAGELNIPDAAPAVASAARDWRQLAAGSAVGLFALAALAWLGRGILGRRAARGGGA